MCGVCGFAGRGNMADLGRMTGALIHRGPDGEGAWSDPDAGVFLGHRRLSVIDISGGAQPMATADGALTVAYNGEIYNAGELRKELEGTGHVFATDHSDTEVLLHGYREWGDRLPEKLNGMWAFALYDRPRRRLFLSRDRFGKKPLFYTVQNGTFAFASELTALIRHAHVAADVSPRSVRKYFAYGYIPAPLSLYERIFKIPAGSNLIVNIDDPSPRIAAYWEFVLEPFARIPEDPASAWGEQLRDLLEKAVRRRLVSDVPLGVFLSGGIDSSAVTAFAARSAGADRLNTFSIGFEEPSFDESVYARRAAGLLGTTHRGAVFTWENLLAVLPDVAKGLDEPMGDSSLLPTYFLAKHTRRHVTVALGGDGGDELFAGYDPFRALKRAELYARLVPRPVHRAVRRLAALAPVSHRNMSLDFKIKRTLLGLSCPKKLWNPVWLGPVSPEDAAELFREPADPEDVYSEAIACWDACRQPDIIDRTLQFYTRLYLENGILVKTDRAAMMNSLEVRAPFLDIDLVDFVRRIPAAWKYRNGQTKYILKKALEPVLPKDVIYRPKKGFGVPVGKWFAENRLRVDPSADTFGLAPDVIRKTQREHRAGRADHRLFLWNLWLLQHMGVAGS